MRLDSGYCYQNGSAIPQLEEALSKSQHFIERLTQTLPNILYIYDLTERRNIYISSSVTTVLGYDPAVFCQVESSFLAGLLHPDDVATVIRHYQQLLTIPDEMVLEVVYRLRLSSGEWCWLSSRDTVFARSADGIPRQILGVARDITRHKQAEAEIHQQAERERLVGKIARRIHQSLDLPEILNTTVADVRHFLQTDRVIIYQFQPVPNGVVIVESVGEGWMPILGTTIKDPCFNEIFLSQYQQGRVRAIADVHNSGLAQCHIDLLTQFQVKANLVLPIIQGNVLWGLLIAQHCRSPRQWQPVEVELLQDLAMQAAITIQQSELYQQVQILNSNLECQVRERTQQLQQSLEFAEVSQRITDRVRDSLDERQILQTAVGELVSALKVDYCAAALYNAERTTAVVQYEHNATNTKTGIGQVLTVADTAKVHRRLLNGEYFAAYESERVRYLAAAETGDMACPDLFDHLATKLLYPIFLDPVACASTLYTDACQVDTGAIGYLIVINQSHRHFSEAEIKLVKQVANQCAIAMRQARLYQASQAQVKALERLNHLKDDFLSTVSHELRTPIASMKMAIQMLGMSMGQELSSQSDKNIRYLKILNEQCERETGLINDLLDLQNLEAGGLPLHPEVIDVQPWLTDIVQKFQAQADNRQQHLQVELATNLPEFMCDSASLERILLELLNNASKYSPVGAEIKLIGRSADLSMCFSVCNSGVEIPVTEFSHIFDKFYRIPSSDPWKQGGTGLGLALVEKLVSHLGGAIAVDSSETQTCFTIRLPLEINLTTTPDLNTAKSLASEKPGI